MSSSSGASARVTLLGVGLGLVANAFHLHSMYVVKVSPIKPGDTLVLRALVQTGLFGLWSTLAFIQKKKYQPIDSSRRQVEWKAWIIAVVASLWMAIVVLLTFMAIEMMPLSDFVVFSFTAPIFTLITSYFMLSKRLTVLSLLFAVAIVVGAGMVAQPTFIFGIVDNPVAQDTYAGGVALAMVVAVLSGSSRTLVAKSSRVMSSSDFMLLGGLAALILGVMTPLFRVENSVLHPLEFINDPNMKYGLASGVESCMSALLLLLGTRITDDPVLISVVRSTEIVMGLLLDMMVPASAALIDFYSMFFWYKVIGAFLVTLSVMGITLSDKMYDAILECFGHPRSPSRCQYQEIYNTSEEGNQQESTNKLQDHQPPFSDAYGLEDGDRFV